MITPVPFLIDGNNVLFALKKAGTEANRIGLCRHLGELARAGEKVTVVFDGPPPQGPLAREVDEPGVTIYFSSGRTADEVIAELILADTAPRRLTVVSTDHEIRRNAHKRRCPTLDSEAFAEILLSPPATRRPGEPAEKRQGLLSEEETEAWLKEFHLDTLDDEPEDRP
jgi:hypothetical protein